MTLKKEWKNKTLDTDKMYWVLFKDCKSPEVRKLNQNCQFIDRFWRKVRNDMEESKK